MAARPPLFTAITSSARQLLLLLRSLAPSKKAQVRLSPTGIRFSTSDGSALESFIFLEKALFTTYTYHAPAPASSQDDEAPVPPAFEIDLHSLLETLNIFTVSDVSNLGKQQRPTEYEAFRLNRHANFNAFSNHALGLSGTCRLTYEGEGSPLTVNMSESGVSTTCELTTYEAVTEEEIPFNRDDLAVKTIMRSSCLLDAVAELSSINPAEITLSATPNSRSASISLTATGALGTAAIDFTTSTQSETPILETFNCPARTHASFKFALVKAAQRAMAAATKVSVRLDAEGVLSLQFLIEVGAESAGGGQGAAFVDFRIVPLAEGEANEQDGHSESDNE